jgi:hypothetical protein
VRVAFTRERLGSGEVNATNGRSALEIDASRAGRHQHFVHAAIDVPPRSADLGANSGGVPVRIVTTAAATTLTLQHHHVDVSATLRCNEANLPAAVLWPRHIYIVPAAALAVHLWCHHHHHHVDARAGGPLTGHFVTLVNPFVADEDAALLRCAVPEASVAAVTAALETRVTDMLPGLQPELLRATMRRCVALARPEQLCHALELQAWLQEQLAGGPAAMAQLVNTVGSKVATIELVRRAGGQSQAQLMMLLAPPLPPPPPQPRDLCDRCLLPHVFDWALELRRRRFADRASPPPLKQLTAADRAIVAAAGFAPTVQHQKLLWNRVAKLGVADPRLEHHPSAAAARLTPVPDVERGTRVERRKGRVRLLLGPWLFVRLVGHRLRATLLDAQTHQDVGVSQKDECRARTHKH